MIAPEGLTLLSTLLELQGDDQALWNMRKNILKELLGNPEKSAPGPILELLKIELALTLKCLTMNPKSYGPWYHRYWTVQLIPTEQMDWSQEAKHISKLLDLDTRNCKSFSSMDLSS